MKKIIFLTTVLLSSIANAQSPVEEKLKHLINDAGFSCHHVEGYNITKQGNIMEVWCDDWNQHYRLTNKGSYAVVDKLID